MDTRWQCKFSHRPTLEFPIFVGWKFHFFKTRNQNEACGFLWNRILNSDIYNKWTSRKPSAVKHPRLLLQLQQSFIIHYITSDSGETENVPSPTNCDRTSPKYRAAVPVWSAAVLHIWCRIKTPQIQTLQMLLNKMETLEHNVQRRPLPPSAFTFTVIR